QDMTEATLTAQHLADTAKTIDKPVLASWMGGPAIAAGEDILNSNGIPTFPYPDTAARAFCYMVQYSHNLELLYETPALDDDDKAIHAGPPLQVETLVDSDRTLLTEAES